MLKRIFFVVLVVAVLLLALYCYMPIKFAINEDVLSTKERYIIVEHQYTTAALWTVVGDENGIYEDPVDATLLGNYPDVGYYMQVGNNRYVCYADYKGETVVGGYQNVVYYVNDWDILYPIQRDNIIPLPKAYLSRLDFDMP